MSEPRGHWSSNTGLILAATGSAIGLGNLWKFPFVTWENNGGAFVLVYLVCIAAVGLPIMMAELLIGRATQKSVVGALKQAIGPAWGIVGLRGVLCGFLLPWCITLDNSKGISRLRFWAKKRRVNGINDLPVFMHKAEKQRRRRSTWRLRDEIFLEGLREEG